MKKYYYQWLRFRVWLHDKLKWHQCPRMYRYRGGVMWFNCQRRRGHWGKHVTFVGTKWSDDHD